MLQPFPEFTEHFESWKAFILKEGLKVIPIFAQFAYRPAFIMSKMRYCHQAHPSHFSHPIQQRIKKLDPLWFSRLLRLDNLHQNSQTKHH